MERLSANGLYTKLAEGHTMKLITSSDATQKLRVSP